MNTKSGKGYFYARGQRDANSPIRNSLRSRFMRQGLSTWCLTAYQMGFFDGMGKL